MVIAYIMENLGGSPTLEQMAAVEVAFCSGFANQSHFRFNFKRVSESAEAVSDFRKNLLKSARSLKTSLKSPVSLPGHRAGQPDLRRLETRSYQSYVSIQAIS